MIGGAKTRESSIRLNETYNFVKFCVAPDAVGSLVVLSQLDKTLMSPTVCHG